MARFSAGLLVVALLACVSASRAVYVNDTVTAVAIRPQYMTTILLLVSTYNCAVDNTIFLADFTTCDFQFVEDVMSGAAKVSPVDCDRKCATQWPVLGRKCRNQFRERMENNGSFGGLAQEFFDKCDSKYVEVTAGYGTGSTSGSGSSGSGTVSATTLDPSTPTLNPDGTTAAGTDGATTTGTDGSTGTGTDGSTTTGTDGSTATDGTEAAGGDGTMQGVGADGSTAPAPAPSTTAEVDDAEDDAVTAAGAMAPSPGSGASSAALQRAALALVGAVMLML